MDTLYQTHSVPLLSSIVWCLSDKYTKKKLSVDSALLLEYFYHTGPSNSVSVKLSWESGIHYLASSTKFSQKRVQKPELPA